MHSRISSTIVVTAVLLLVSGVAWAQEETSSTSGTIDVGVIATDIDGDGARFQRYRDLRDGVMANFRLNYEGSDWLMSFGADSAGRRDQRFFGVLEQPGKFALDIEWDQIPLFYSERTRSLYTVGSSGTLLLDDDIQAGVQGRQFTVADIFDARATRFDLRSKSNYGTVRAEYIASSDLDFTAELKTRARSGNMPYAASFGFSQVVEVPLPLDDTTTDYTLGAEWGNGDALLRVGYTGSKYDNDLKSLIWDNTNFAADSFSASSRGQMALAPSNTSHTVTTTGSVKLPSRSRLTGTLSLGTYEQNEALLPFSINSVLEPIALDRTTAQAKAKTTAANVAFTSRPSRNLRINARYRYYDYDNQTPVFNADEYYRFDGGPVRTGSGHTEPYSIQRQNLDADVSYSIARFTTLGVGYGHESGDRTFRIFGKTKEDKFRATFTSMGSRFVTVRAKFESSKRDGEEFDPHVLEAVGERPGMRHYDIANRDRTRFTVGVSLMPSDMFGVNLSAASGKDDFKDSLFGLQEYKNNIYTVGFDATPNDDVYFGGSYTYEKYEATSRHRDASPPPSSTWTDATRDWTTDSDDTIHTFSGNFDLTGMASKFNLHLGYDYSTSEAVYVFARVSGIPTEPLAPVQNDLQRATVDARFKLSDAISIGAVYWYDKYDVEDYSNGGSTGNTPSGGLLLGYFYEPFTVHTGWLRLIVDF